MKTKKATEIKNAFSKKKNDSKISQLSRQNKQKNNWPNILFETDFFPLKKQVLVRRPGQLGRPRRFY